MTEQIKEFIRNIFLIYLITILGCDLLPDKKYVNYLKVFMGIIMLIYIMAPVRKIMSIDNPIAYLSGYNLETGIDEKVKKELIKAGNIAYSEVERQYGEMILKETDRYISQFGYKTDYVLVSIDFNEESEGFGSVSSITLQLEKICDDASSKTVVISLLKSFLSDFYKVMEANIYIMCKD